MEPRPKSTPAQERQALAAAIDRVSGGSDAALAEVYDRTSAKLFGVCLRILGDQGEAEDALQDVYVSVWRRAGSFDASRASAISWLAAIARNRAIDRLRSAGRPRPTVPMEQALDVPDAGDDALALLETDEERKRLMHCLDELESPASGAIRAAFFDGFTYAELATRAGVPLATMKSWVRRGLIRLRGCMDR
jgi:RNA polymerase sigma-70 factor (ECF subfamily)